MPSLLPVVPTTRFAPPGPRPELRSSGTSAERPGHERPWHNHSPRSAGVDQGQVMKAEVLHRPGHRAHIALIEGLDQNHSQFMGAILLRPQGTSLATLVAMPSCAPHPPHRQRVVDLGSFSASIPGEVERTAIPSRLRRAFTSLPVNCLRAWLLLITRLSRGRRSRRSDQGPCPGRRERMRPCPCSPVSAPAGPGPHKQRESPFLRDRRPEWPPAVDIEPLLLALHPMLLDLGHVMGHIVEQLQLGAGEVAVEDLLVQWAMICGWPRHSWRRRPWPRSSDLPRECPEERRPAAYQGCRYCTFSPLWTGRPGDRCRSGGPPPVSRSGSSL